MFTRIMGKHPISATMRDAVCNKAVVRPTNAARATVDVQVKRLCVPTYARVIVCRTTVYDPFVGSRVSCLLRGLTFLSQSDV